MKTSKRDSGGGSTQLAATSTGGSGGSQQQLTGGYKTREKQLGDVEKRINESEKNLAKLCEDFGAIARKTARLRDKGDILAEDLLNMADHEHKSGKQALQQSAQLLSLVQDYRQTQIERLEHKVIQPLKDYKELCRKGKADLKRTGDAYKKEKSQQAAVQKMGSTGKEHNISQVSKAQSELRQSAAQAAKQTKDLEQGCQSFEERRVADMKQVLQDFIHIEMLFHAKALEIYTNMYRSVNVFDVQQDLEEFRQTLRPAGLMLPTQHVNTAANEEEEEEDDDDDDDEEYEDGDEEEEESELGTTVDSRASHLAQTAKTNGSRLTGGGRGDVDDSITYTNNENGTHQHVSEADQDESEEDDVSSEDYEENNAV
ncbi:CBY1-interacting BAR domain-containing protein 1-like [Convolutriloba macropyga]|uniref:CBY1-interacting BAR domain-containing protein 1-like n=1 Tax=Convolutriloba macropyga TaxID=536237 RepID=UPI003F51DA62